MSRIKEICETHLHAIDGVIGQLWIDRKLIPFCVSLSKLRDMVSVVNVRKFVNQFLLTLLIKDIARQVRLSLQFLHFGSLQ